MAEYPRLCEQYEAKGVTLDRDIGDHPVFGTLDRPVLEEMAGGDKEVSCSACPVRCDWKQFGILILHVTEPKACVVSSVIEI